MDSLLLKEEALKLSPSEKAQLIDALWQSLESPERESADQAWLEESQDRLSAYRRGQIKAVDGAGALCLSNLRLSDGV